MVVTSFNSSDDSNLDSWTNWKSPIVFLDFLNTFTLATSPTNVFRLLKFIFAKEPVSAESVIVCPSTNSKVVL